MKPYRSHRVSTSEAFLRFLDFSPSRAHAGLPHHPSLRREELQREVIGIWRQGRDLLCDLLLHCKRCRGRQWERWLYGREEDLGRSGPSRSLQRELVASGNMKQTPADDGHPVPCARDSAFPIVCLGPKVSTGLFASLKRHSSGNKLLRNR